MERRRARGRYKKRTADRTAVRRYLLFCCCLCVLGILLTATGGVLGPAISSAAELQVRNMITKSINQAVAEEMLSGEISGQLIQVQTGADGMIQADTIAMNRMAASLTGRIQERITSLGEESIAIPFGSVFGSQLLSQIGPKLKLKVVPIGAAEVGFKTEFESSGINQTRHRIYLEVSSTARILAPFSLAKIQTSDVILVAETVIVGDVPQSYVFVPENDILDGLDSGME